MEINQILEFIKATRPTAIFSDVIFLNEPNENVVSYYYASFYDLNIDSNFVVINGTPVVMHNTYLSSFVYNLSNCWLFGINREEQNSEPSLNWLLTYNLKKFYSEQLYQVKNCVLSRALLLETLLFGQRHMIPVVEAAMNDPNYNSISALNQNIAFSILSHHELAHHLLKHNEGIWEVFSEQNKQVMKPLFPIIAQSIPSLQEEIKCDLFSFILNLEKMRETQPLPLLLNLFVFNYAAIFVMYSLKSSAEKSINDNTQYIKAHKVDFTSTQRGDIPYELSFIPDKGMLERCRLMIDICSHIALLNDVTIFEQVPAFPISEQIIDQLASLVDNILDFDLNDRGIAKLVAESLEGHPQGMDYLYLNSRQFTSQR